MLRAKRNSRLAESLGPPVRFTSADIADESKEEAAQILPSKPPSGGRPHLSSRSRHHGKENRYHGGTPRERSPISSNRGTPNSTYPASLCGSSGIITKSVKLVERQTPSSTFPVSLPINGGHTSQNTRVTEHHTPAPTERQVSQVVEEKATCDHPPSDHTSGSVKPVTSSEAPPTLHKSKSVPHQLEAGLPQSEDSQQPTQRSLLPSKLNLGGAMARRASEDRGVPTPLSTTAAPPPPPPGRLRQESDIVTLASASGERRFKRMKLIGTGGSSKVFKVVSEEDFQTYALKEVYLKYVDPAIKNAYVNEIKLLNKLTSKPEIITLHYYTFNKHEATLYLLLEYAEMDLNAILKTHTTVNHMATVLYFWNQMLEVVKVIHDEGVIHNDLKPENFVCIGARLKLIDFGIANRIETEKTSIERDIRCGTINYMSPETIEANDVLDCFKVGRPSDVWSLGCILYQMVYGRTPFQHIKNKLKKWQAITDASISIPFPEISSPAALDVMKRCLSRDPKTRPTVDELLAHPFSTMAHC